MNNFTVILAELRRACTTCQERFCVSTGIGIRISMILHLGEREQHVRIAPLPLNAGRVVLVIVEDSAWHVRPTDVPYVDRHVQTDTGTRSEDEVA